MALVTDIHPPGATTYRLDGGGSGGALGAPALAVDGELEETLLIETTHGLDAASAATGSVFETLRAMLDACGLSPRDRSYHDIPHTLMFVQAAETMRRIYDPAHVPYGVSSNLYAHTGRIAEVEAAIWPRHLAGELTRDEALRQIVDALAPAPPPPAEGD